MKWRPHTGQRHSSIPEGSVPSWTISCGGGARIGGSFLGRSLGWCTQDSRTPTGASHEKERVALPERGDLEVLADQADVVVEGAGQAGGDGDAVAHDAVGLAGAGLDEVVAAADPPAGEVPFLGEGVAGRVQGDLA